MSNLKTQNQNLKLKSNVRYRAFQFSLKIIKFAANLPKKQPFFIITDQFLRCSTSIGANLIEAKASSSKKDFIHFYEIALKSANETLYWLYLLRDGNLIEKENVNNLLREAKEIGDMIGSSLLTMKNKKMNRL